MRETTGYEEIDKIYKEGSKKQFEIYKVSGRYGSNRTRVHLTVKIVEDNSLWTKVKSEDHWGNPFEYTFFKPYKKLKWKRGDKYGSNE